MNQARIDSSGASRGSFDAYFTGFILSIALTVIAFGLVMSDKTPVRPW
jgi:heme/copper-type cytochrome/quinol oxidase subunit 4